MQRKLVSIICAVLMMISSCCMFSFSASAFSPDYDIVNQSFDDLVSNYNLSSSDISGKQVCYFSGHSYDKTVYCSTLWLDNKVYRIKIENGEKGFYSNTYESKYPLLTGQYVGYLSCGAFYYSLGDTQVPPRYQLTYASVNDADIAVSLSSNVTNYGGTDVFITNYSGSGTLGDMAADSALQNAPAPDPTEPETSGGFQLPEEWISGGETLPAASEVVYPSGFDPDSAFEQFTDITVELDQTVVSGVGFFWEIVLRSIESLSLMPLVFFSMMFGLIVWFLKGL